MSSAAAGAQAGAAFGPWGAAIGAGAGMLTDVAKASMGGPTTTSAQVDARSWMDGSGWTVSTGGSTSRGGRFGSNTQEGQNPQQQQPRPASASFAPPGYSFDFPQEPIGGSVAGIPVIGIALVGLAFILARR